MRDNSYVYILGNDRPTIYIGVTSNLVRRLTEHRSGSFDGFTSKYGLTKLLYSETYPSIEDAIAREKHLKG